MIKTCHIHIKKSDVLAVYENLQRKQEPKCLKSKNKVQKKYQCEKCKRSYVHQSSLYTHKRYACGVEPKFACNFCGHKTRQKIHILNHVASNHLKSGKYNRYKDYLRRKQERKFKCHRCGRNYLYQGSLYNHERNECGVEPKFVCDYCGHKSKQKGSLLVHIINRHLKK